MPLPGGRYHLVRLYLELPPVSGTLYLSLELHLQIIPHLLQCLLLLPPPNWDVSVTVDTCVPLVYTACLPCLLLPFYHRYLLQATLELPPPATVTGHCDWNAACHRACSCRGTGIHPAGGTCQNKLPPVLRYRRYTVRVPACLPPAWAGYWVIPPFRSITCLWNLGLEHLFWVGLPVTWIYNTVAQLLVPAVTTAGSPFLHRSQTSTVFLFWNTTSSSGLPSSQDATVPPVHACHILLLWKDCSLMGLHFCHFYLHLFCLHSGIPLPVSRNSTF